MSINSLKLTLVSLLLSFAAAAQTIITSEGTGYAPYGGKPEQLQAATDKAKEAALREAIEKAAGVKISADTVVVNNQLVMDQILMNTSGYVKKYEVLETKPEPQRMTVTVKVKADIITENLDKDIAAARQLVKEVGRPRIIIIIQEQTLTAEGKATQNSEAMATVLTDSFRADGWDVRDEKMFNDKFTLEGAITLGPTQLKEIHDKAKADYILYGKAAVRHEAPAGGFAAAQKDVVFYVSGEYDLTLAATDTGTQVSKIAGALRMSPKTKETFVSYERTALSVMKERAPEITGPVRKAILEYFRDQKVNGYKFELTVSGLEFNAVKDFTKSIETMKGMKETEQGGFKNGTVSYRLTYFGKPNDFANSIAESTFKKKKLNVVSVTASTVEVQVAK